MRYALTVLLASLPHLASLTGAAGAASTCYLYDGDAYWICLREERADDQDAERLREQIEEAARQAAGASVGEGQ